MNRAQIAHIVVGALLASLPAGYAHAATVEADETKGYVTITAQSGEVNDARLSVQQTELGRTLAFRDGGASPDAGVGCTESAGEIRCELSSPTLTVEVDLKDGDDSLDATSDSALLTLKAQLGTGTDTASLGPGGEICGGLPCRLSGGQGSDTLTGSDSNNNELVGGRGDDHLIANGSSFFEGGKGDDTMQGGGSSDFLKGPEPGDDFFDGGEGQDLIDDRAGADTLLGGAGSDDFTALRTSPSRRSADVIDGGTDRDFYFAFCGSCAISLDGQPNDGAEGGAEGDSVTIEQFEVSARVEGDRGLRGSGADRLVGNAEANTIYATQGADLVIGRSGPDQLVAGAGDDVVKADDGERDETISCGRGRDVAYIDELDRPQKNCEQVERSRA